MKTFLKLLLLILPFTNFGQQSVIITGATIFDGTDIKEGYNVKVDRGIITEISQQELHGDSIINATGKFLMPALTNAHVHCWNPSQLKEAAQAGVLNLLDMHGLEPMQKMMVNLRTETSGARYY